MKNRRFVILLCLSLLLVFLPGCEKQGEPEFTRPAKEGQTGKEYGIPAFVNAVRAPEEGDDPLILSGAENVYRIAYRLQHADHYALDGRGTVSTKVAFISYTQDVEIYKDYSRGILLETDVTKSSVKNGAWQTCYCGDTALLRGAAGGKKTWNGRNTEWESGDPEIFSREKYRADYGLFGFELSNYILNEDTISDFSPAADNGDGTFTQTIRPDLTAATGDCIRRMRTMGGLDSDPVFKDAEITLTFDRNWRILSMHIEETYSIRLGIIRSDNCRAVTDYTYSYENADVTDFDEYFARYVEE